MKKEKVSVGTFYIILLGLAAFVISSIGATFSVTGLAKLFSGAALAVMFMAGSLEFAKVVSAAFLHRNWARLGIGLRIYLSVAVLILMAITSMGIFGYLSHAYQKSSVGLGAVNIRLQGLKTEDARVQAELDRLQKNLDEIPKNRITKKMEAEKEAEPEILKLKRTSLEVNVQMQQAMIEKQGYQTEIGPLVYVADAFGVPMDVVARWFIFMFVSVFDPLAICLVFATSWAIKTRAHDLETAREERELAKVSAAEKAKAAEADRARGDVEERLRAVSEQLKAPVADPIKTGTESIRAVS
jgi:hypothetical protein